MSHTVGANTANYVWDVNRGVPEILQDGTNTYVYGLGRISSTDGAGNQTYYTGDGLGSSTDLTNSSATRTDGYTYDVFGTPTHAPGSSSNPFQFAGEQTDADSGLQYLRARYYDPATGRFLGRDPFPGLAALPATQNPYAYALNNPVNLTDPTGLYSVMDLLQDLRPVLGCTLVMFGFSDFSCIGDYLNAIAAYNDFVFDFLKRFGTLNCLNAALSISALAANIWLPGGGYFATIALFSYGAHAWGLSSAISLSQIDKKEGLSFSNIITVSGASVDSAAFLTSLTLGKVPAMAVANRYFGVVGAGISTAQCLDDAF